MFFFVAVAGEGNERNELVGAVTCVYVNKVQVKKFGTTIDSWIMSVCVNERMRRSINQLISWETRIT